MNMMNTGDILETIEMFTQDNLDVRTVTMGISLLDCIDPDPKKACEKIYNKITTRAARLVPAVEHISAEYGIPIINKRISVTPIAMLLGCLLYTSQFGDAGARRPDERRRLAGRRGERLPDGGRRTLSRLDVYKRQ